MRRVTIILTILFAVQYIQAQPVPNVEENIPHLMTFGNEAEVSWGDDDFSQAFFFLVPEDYEGQVYIRVFDPDTGGAIDENRGNWNTQCTYEVFGGKGCHSDVDARETSPTGNYKSGNMLAMRIFGESPRYDENWYTFGPFTPDQGELTPEFKGYIFKVICEGVAGDDGNMFNYFLSTSGTENKAIEGANAFAYEYSFRMHNDPNEVSHIYPYITEGTLSVKIFNFDWDWDGQIRIVSRMRESQQVAVSGDAIDGSDPDWEKNEFSIYDEEIKTSFDFQFVKAKNPPVRNNNVVVNVRNQYDETMPFYTSPIGGVPQYQYSGIMEAIDD